jgi:hypothetical protein
MGANLARVIVTVVAARFWTAETVTGDPWHELAGLTVYALACIMMIITARALTTQSSTPSH